MSREAPSWVSVVAQALSRDPIPKNRNKIKPKTPQSAADITRLLANNKKRRERNEWLTEISKIAVQAGEEFHIEPSDCLTIFRDHDNVETFRLPHAMDILALTNQRLVVLADRPRNIWKNHPETVPSHFHHYANTVPEHVMVTQTLPNGETYPHLTITLQSGGHLVIYHPEAEKIADFLHNKAS